jgi:Zn-dependent protease with chaperone function
MTVDQAIRSILSHLPPDVSEALEHVDIDHRPYPTPADKALGVTDGHYGYYRGSSRERVHTTELPADLPQGQIVIFTGNIKPLTQAGIARVLLHEIAHVIGYDEQQITSEMGL